MSASRQRQPAQYDEAIAAVIDRRLLDVNGQPVCQFRADEAMVRIVSTALRLQLAARRGRGVKGWHEGKNRNAKLRAELVEAVAAGEMADCLRLAAAIQLRAHLYGAEA